MKEPVAGDPQMVLGVDESPPLFYDTHLRQNNVWPDYAGHRHAPRTFQGAATSKAPATMKSAQPTSLGIMLASLILTATTLLITTDAHSATWRETKCTLYQENRDETRAAMPANATSNAFNQQEDAFIASGCTERIYVCPHSKAELAYANLMSIKMMNAGATGSFLPFVCEGGLQTDQPTQ
ncbi:MAG: hypothetical protein CMO05_06365 [Thalassospira sp.]|nr:hypothetical protein [Thalassospira sp.]